MKRYNKLEKLILKQPAEHVLVWSTRVDGKLEPVHRIEFKSTLTQSQFDIVYRDRDGNKNIGSGTKTKILKRLLALVK